MKVRDIAVVMISRTSNISSLRSDHMIHVIAFQMSFDQPAGAIEHEDSVAQSQALQSLLERLKRRSQWTGPDTDKAFQR